MRYLIAFLVIISPTTQALGQQEVLSTTPATRDSVIRILHELASAISRRDADDATRYIREDHHAVYVSDGRLIRGREYRETLRHFYQGFRSLQFSWDSLEIESATRGTCVATGWASITAVDTADQHIDSRAVFSFVLGHTRTKWEIITAHKTTLSSSTKASSQDQHLVGTWKLESILDTLPDGSPNRAR